MVVRDTVPTNTTFASCTGGTSCSNAPPVTWNVGTLAPGATATLTFTVSVNSGLAISDTLYTVSNTGNVTSTEITTPVNSNTVQNQVQVKPEITKSVDLDTVGAGGTLTYTFVIENPGAAFTANVTDPVPANTTYVAASCQPTPCSLSAGAVTWSAARSTRAPMCSHSK